MVHKLSSGKKVTNILNMLHIWNKNKMAEQNNESNRSSSDTKIEEQISMAVFHFYTATKILCCRWK